MFVDTNIRHEWVIQVKLGISSTGCSPYLDFDDKMYDIKYVIFETDYFLKLFLYSSGSCDVIR